MKIAMLSIGAGWHVLDLMRAAALNGHVATVVDFRKIWAGVGEGHPAATNAAAPSLASFDAVVVRTMPPGSLDQDVFRMDVLHRFQAEGKKVLNPPLALETCIDKYLASARLA